MPFRTVSCDGHDLSYPMMARTQQRLPISPQDDSLVGVPSKFNRYKRMGKKKAQEASGDKDGNNGGGEEMGNGRGEDQEVDEGDHAWGGGGGGLTLIKIRLFKEVKKDEASGGPVLGTNGTVRRNGVSRYPEIAPTA